MSWKIKKIFTNVRVVILLFVILMAIVSINPNPWNKGAAIRNVISGSAAEAAGIAQPTSTVRPMNRERVLSINNKPVNNADDYFSIVQQLRINQSVRIRTSESTYSLTVREQLEVIMLNETVNETYEEIVPENQTINGNRVEVNTTVINQREVKKTRSVSLGPEDIGLRVYDAPTSNIKKGLDLQGGTRVLLQPEKTLNDEEMGTIMDNIEERLNVYGLSDLVVRSAGDLSGNRYIIVEIAGANEEDIRNLIGTQGKFEAKISNKTVFRGGGDIEYVCKTATCSGIESCSGQEGYYVCNFHFKIIVSGEASQRFADATKDLSIVSEADGEKHLSEKIVFYLDDKVTNMLDIASGLKGSKTTEAVITGAGTGTTRDNAIIAASADMNQLQTILKTGSLPVKLNIVKIDAISPVLGEEFVNNALLLAAMSICAVFIIILIRYRKLKIALPLSIISFSEIIILMGISTLIGWNLDMAAIGGIIIAIGTSVDHQIVITDEALKGESRGVFNWKERIKNAFSIITASFLTVAVAMLPLMSAGAGLLKGFAITTIIGISVGVFVARPVYAQLIEILLKD